MLYLAQAGLSPMDRNFTVTSTKGFWKTLTEGRKQRSRGGDRRSRARGAVARSAGAVIEGLEGRRMLTLSSPGLISVNTGGGSADAASGSLSGVHVAHGQMSMDGSMVVFESDASDLTAQGQSGTNVYVRDRNNNRTILVSVDASGRGAGGSLASISEDGKFVVFVSDADLTANDGNGLPDVFVRDLTKGTTTLISEDKSGMAVGVDANSPPVISDNDRFVAYTSAADASMIDANATSDQNSADDVFRRDITGGTTDLVSFGTQMGQVGSGKSANPVISADGTKIAFESDSKDLTSTADNNGQTDVFLRDMVSGTTTLVSINNSGSGSGSNASHSPQITADGTRVAFISQANDLAGGDRGGSKADVFLYNVANGTNTLVSSDVTGQGQDGSVGVFDMSASGLYIAFSSTAANMGAKFDPAFPINIYRKNMSTRALDLLSSQANTGATADSGGSSLTRSVSISYDGRFVVWDSDGINVAPNFTNPQVIASAQPPKFYSQIYMRDVLLKTTFPVSAIPVVQGQPQVGGNNNRGLNGNADSGFVTISQDGTTIIWDSNANDLVSTDRNGTSDVLEVDNTLPDASPPTASVTSAPDVTTATAASPETIVITYADDVAMRVTTMDSRDISVSGPKGYLKLATLVSVDVSVNGTPRVATYQVPPPNGVAWVLADRGVYTITVVSNQVTDLSGKPVPGTGIGTFKVTLGSSDFTPPTASLSAPDVFNSGGTLYQFRVTYQDNAAVDISTLDSNDVRVTGPGLFNVLATFVSATRSTNGTPVTATYQFVPPGGTWDLGDNGTYTVAMQKDQVLDVNGNSVLPLNLGTFKVAAGTTGLEFSAPTYTVNEGSSVATITVKRTQDLSGAVTVDYAASAGTAVGGVNFQAVQGTLTFADGVDTQSFAVPILDDPAVDGALTVNLALSNAQGQAAFVAEPSTAVLTINDNDSNVQFSAAAVGVRRDAGAVPLTVTRVGAVDNPVDVVYSTVNGTAVAGTDYLATSGTLNFAKGQRSQTIVVPILSTPAIFQPTVQFNVTLSSVSGDSSTRLGTNATTTVTINGGPRVMGVNLMNARGRVDRVERIAIHFDRPLDGASTANLSNYILTQKNGVDGRFTTRVRLADAVYDAATMTIYLFPSKPLVINRMYQLSLSTVGTLADADGTTVVTGQTGDAGGRFVALIERGNNINYVDRNSNNVNLQLRQGGIMEMVLGFDDTDPTINILSKNPGRTTLVGNVRKGKHGTGLTTIAALNGVSGIINRLTNPPFNVKVVTQ